MAIAPVNKFISVAVPVAPGLQKLYEVPTGTSALVLYAQVANVGVGTYPTVTFLQRRESRSTGLTRDVRVIKDVEIPPNDGVILVDGRMVLEKTPLVVDRIYIRGIQSGINTITDVQYCEPLGIATVVTIDNHGFSTGDDITLSGIAFTCSNNTSGITTNIFPDPQASYTVASVLSTKAFTTIVGTSNGINHFYNAAIHKFVRSKDQSVTQNSTSTKFTPRGATYIPGTGVLTLTINNHNMLAGATSYTPNGAYYTASSGIMTVTMATPHGFSTGNLVKFNDNALSFNCLMDGNSSTKTYPRSTDPISGVWKKITVGTSTDFSLNVGISTLVTFTPTAAIYSASTGIATFTIGNHDLPVGTSVKLATESIKFTCDQDGHASVKSYPRPTIDSHTATNADYTPSSGIMTVTTSSAHGMRVGDWVKLDDNSLTFTCAQDGNATNHTYPRSSDPISGKYIQVAAVKSTDTFDIQVLDSIPSTNTTNHQFVPGSGTAGGIKQKRDRSYDTAVNIQSVTETSITLNVGASSYTGIHTFVSADPGSVISGGDYTHTFVSCVTNGMKKSNESIGIATESLIFTCSQDGYFSEKYYPRTTDPAHNTSLAVIEATDNTIQVNVGISTQGGLVAPLQMEFLASILENSNA